MLAVAGLPLTHKHAQVLLHRHRLPAVVVDVQQIGAETHFDDVVARRVEAVSESDRRLLAGRHVDIAFLDAAAIDVKLDQVMIAGLRAKVCAPGRAKPTSRAVVANGASGERPVTARFSAWRLADVDHGQRRALGECGQPLVVLRLVGVLQVGHPGIAAQIGEEIDLLPRPAAAFGRR